jgi:guanylate cyclase
MSGFKNLFLGYFQWVGQYAPGDGEINRVRVAIAVFSSGMGVFFSTTIGLFVYWNNETLAGWILFGLAGWMVFPVILYIWKWIAFTTFARLSFIGLLLVNITCTTLLGGLRGSGAFIVWSLLPALLAAILLTTRETLYWGFIFLGLLTISLFLPDMLGQKSELSLEMEKFLFLFNIGGIAGFVLAFLQFFVVQRDQYQERSDSLLLNILPREIADILRNENRVVAEAFEGASILFADVVNFTPLSATMTPVELVNLLNEVFSHFDTLTEKHRLEKIKTIGDCYMVASGIPRPRADHAQAVTNMALDIVEYVKTHDFNGRKLAFRIGINSGPVVAGVIGQKKFAYDLWGDAVNTASRMESHGASNIIQVTRDTYELIKNDFACAAQKNITVKGKGEMEVWHVTGRK